MAVTVRIPTKRCQLDNIEEGLRIFISDINDNGYMEAETCGTFVLTSSDGSRFYAFWSGSKNKMFVAISRYPNYSCSRQIIKLLSLEKRRSIKGILFSLCEVPILPIGNVTYVLELNTGYALLEFNSSEQVSDIDIDMIPLSILSPQMIITAWESILLERKVLVVSEIPTLLSPCCEFLRRLVSPLIMINTFIPSLPKQLIDAIEAPFPYLIGAEKIAVINSKADLTDIVVIDLDNRTNSTTKITPEYPNIRIPKILNSKLLREINEVTLKPLDKWIQRSCTSNISIHTEKHYCLQADQITQIFLRTNYELLTARYVSIYLYAIIHICLIICI
jgi:hypothetical protein